jgi:diguanylate cyclase (GGDEF)-like protein
VGDACLVQLGAAMRRIAARPQDLVARYGGEEFAILLPQLDTRGAEGVARRLQGELVQLAIPHAASPTSPSLTVSMGIAALVPADAATPEELVRQADALLYEAKAGGRNRYRVAAAAARHA